MEESVLLTNNHEDSERQGSPLRYEGYEPVHPEDFPFEEDHASAEAEQEPKTIASDLLCDNARTSKSLLICSTVFGISFIAMLVWQILVATCRVSKLCETIDESSKTGTLYVFRTFQFRIPSAFLWLGLTCGAFGFFTASLLAIFILRKEVGTPKMAAIATVVRKSSTSFLIQQDIAAFAPLIVLFVAVGLTVNWRTAGTFALGAILCMTTTEAGISIATRGNVRASAAAHSGLQEAVKVAFRTGSIVGCSVLSIAIAGVCAAYLMFADVRSLTGFVAGTSVTSLFLRVSGGIFTRATSKTASLFHSRREMRIGSTSPKKRKIATYVGSGVGTVFGLGPDLFESFAATIIASAILASSLPFFYRDSYAMCIYNHLGIDQYCGPFGYPEQLSYAIYVCRNDNLYLSYPKLTTWASNTAFIAAPFVLGAAGLLVSLVCALYVRTRTQSSTAHTRSKSDVQSLRFSIRLNMLLGSVLLVASSAAIFFGLFGPRSSFQAAVGLGNNIGLRRMELRGNVESACLATSLNVTEASAFNPFPIPQGGEYIVDQYRPVNDVGRQIGPAYTTDQRLFGCAVLGIILGVLMTGFCSVFFTSEAFQPTQRVAIAAHFGTVSAVLQGLGNGLLGCFPPTIFLLIGILSSYALYGAYGVGIMSVAFLSGTGVVATGSVLGSIADNARGIARIASFSKRAQRDTSMLDSVGAAVSIAGSEFANSGAFLAAISILFAAIQTSGMFPSPTEIVGSQEAPPTRLIWKTGDVPTWSIQVITGVMIGIAEPFIVAGLLLLSVRRAAFSMAREGTSTRDQKDTFYSYFIGAVTRECLRESVLPVLTIIMTPLVVGFGFGQRALLAMLITLIGTGFALSTSLTSAAGSWEGAERIMASRGGPRTRGTSKHWSALYARELGSPLRECVAPGMQSMMKTTASVVLVVISLTEPDGGKVWIGCVFFAIFIALSLGFAFWKKLRNARLKNERITSDRDQNSPLKQVSPFFEDAITVDPKSAVPGSQMANALDSVQNSRAPVTVDSLPGLSDRSQADLGNLNHLKGTHAIASQDGFVLKDEIREL